MGEFDTAWLTLREPYDHHARSDEALAPVLRSVNNDTPLHILDIGAGGGSNLRYLAPRLPAGQHWTLADSDPDLLAHAQKTCREFAHVDTVALHQVDLAADLTTLPFSDYTLVTASAFIDLVSEVWIDAFAHQVRTQNVSACLFTLSVDGDISWTPADPSDSEMAGLFSQHMHSDKGFGPASGYQGWQKLADALEAVGYRVTVHDSPWRLQKEDAALQSALLDGYAKAALEIAPDRIADIDAWKLRRQSHIDTSTSQLSVGHKDLVAILDPS